MVRFQPVTDDLLRRLVGTTRAWYARTMKAVRDQDGNPSGVDIVRFGDAVAVATPARPSVHWMNLTEHLFPGDAALVPDIMSFYRGHGVSPTISVPSVGDVSVLARALVSAGLAPWRTLSVLYGRAVSPLPGPTDAAVRTITAAEIDAWSEVWNAGFEHDEQLRAWLRTDQRAWPSFDGVTLYLAEVGGMPAGAATLVVRDGIGHLANASTLPTFRRRGAHAALLERRIADAAAAGCELVCAIAGFASTSQNNIERIGLRLAGTLTQWRPMSAA